MDEEGRSMVMMAASRGPILVLRLSRSYLRMRRSANAARKRFYRELVQNGLPKNEAKDLADEYSSSLSIRSALKLASAIPLMRR